MYICNVRVVHVGSKQTIVTWDLSVCKKSHSPCHVSRSLCTFFILHRVLYLCLIIMSLHGKGEWNLAMIALTAPEPAKQVAVVELQ